MEAHNQHLQQQFQTMQAQHQQQHSQVLHLLQQLSQPRTSAPLPPSTLNHGHPVPPPARPPPIPPRVSVSQPPRTQIHNTTVRGANTAQGATVPGISTPVHHPIPEKYHDLTFDTLVKDTVSGFEEWLTSVKRKIYLNPNTRGAFDADMNLRPNLPFLAQVKIYDALSTAIKPKKTSAYISKNDEIASNANALLQSLVQRHGTQSTNALVQQEFMQKFVGIKRGPKEGYDKYFDRYLHLKAESKSIKVGVELAIHYLCSLQVNTLNPIITEIAEGNPTVAKWHNSNIATTHGLALDRIAVHKMVTTTESKNTTNPDQNKKNIADFVTKLKEVFPTKPSPEDIVAKSKTLKQCPVHSKGHTLLHCHHFKAAAVDLKWITVWEKAIELSKQERRNRVNNNNDGNNNSSDAAQADQAQANCNRSDNDTNTPSNNYLQHMKTTIMSTQSRLARPTPLPENTPQIATTSLTEPQTSDTVPTSQNHQQTIMKAKAIKKWTYFPPKKTSNLQQAITTCLPHPTTEEINYLHDNDACWDVIPTHHKQSTPAPTFLVADSGTRHTICSNLSMFDEIEVFETAPKPYVQLADDNTL